MSMEADEPARLYGLPLEEFVAARNEAARAARKAGDKEAAAELSALRKPTVAAWAVNQLARRERRDVDLLLDSGKRLLDAQRASLEGGGRDQLDAARASLESAVERLGAAARDVLGDSASETTMTRVVETLRAAALSPEGRALLASGTLTKELQETGWDLLSGLAPEKPPARARPAKKEKQEKRRTSSRPARDPERDAERRQEQARREQLRSARARRAELKRELREARRDEERAFKVLERKREEVRALEAELAEIEAAIEDAGGG
jgi:hypothetical protein